MGLKAVLDNLDELDTSLHEHYKKDEASGKYMLDLDDFDVMPRVKKLKDEAGNWRIKHKDVSAALGAYKVLGEVDAVQALLDRIPELEALADKAGNDPAKLEALLDAKLKGKLAPIERERDLLKQGIAERDAKLGEYSAKEKTRTIGDAIRSAIGKSQGFIPHAVDDAIVFGERMLEIDEDGSVVTKDGAGVTPGVDVSIWLQEMQQRKPHWWGTSQGGGAPGQGRSGNGGGANPFSHEGWNMTEQSRLVREDRKRAEQLAKAAGTSIGGLRPPARK